MFTKDIYGKFLIFIRFTYIPNCIIEQIANKVFQESISLNVSLDSTANGTPQFKFNEQGIWLYYKQKYIYAQSDYLSRLIQ